MTTAPTGSSAAGGCRKSRRLMHFQPETVAERMTEGVAVAARGDQVARQRVAFPAGHAAPDALAGALLGLANQVVDGALPLVGLADRRRFA